MNSALVWGAVTALLTAARPPVVDVHVHTSPKRYGLAADLLAANGVSRFVNLSGGNAEGRLAQSIDAARRYEGRILVCANVKWRDYDAPNFGARQAVLLAEGAALGARCLKIPKVLGLGVPDPSDPAKYMAVDDPRLDPLWAAAGRLGLPVFIHTSDPKAFWEPVSPANERYGELGVHPEWSFADPKYPSREALLAQRDRLLARHRGTTFIGVHFANNPEDIDYVAQALATHPNLYVDVAARVPEIGRHDPAKVRALFERFQDRILFGTDIGITRGLMLGSVGKKRPRLADAILFYADHFRFFETHDRRIPPPTPLQGEWRIDAIGLPPAVLAKLYHGNALRLLWGEAAPSAIDAEALELAPPLSDFME